MACVLKIAESRVVIVEGDGRSREVDLPRPAQLVAHRLLLDRYVLFVSQDHETLVLVLATGKEAQAVEEHAVEAHAVKILSADGPVRSLMACELGAFVGFDDCTIRYEHDADEGLRFQVKIPGKEPGLFFDDAKHQVRTLGWLRINLLEDSVSSACCSWPLVVCRVEGVLAVWNRETKKLIRFSNVRTPEVGVAGRAVCWTHDGCLSVAMC
jgi:hypothetical protein